jgi:hypothetical protein
MNAHYPVVAERAGRRCEYCHAPETIFNFSFEVEHVIAVAHHGPDDHTNLALACRACNLYKAAHRTGFDELTQTEVYLFNPRQDQWDEHFAVDPETCTIRGLTPVGRATVARLRMNADPQLEARRQWQQLELFP